ncbi:MAG: endonuclease III [Muribaculaceae bacterium]|nr:endonuclease III [Muribaculaceae bacterium]MDE6542128.1 endonuclease III [Muribaculaceae bacterium]
MTLKERYAGVIDYFGRTMPAPETELHYGSPFQLLVAVILSAQCTDKRINMVTPALFEAYPDAEAMAQATAEELFEFISSVSYPNNKAKALAAMSRKLVADFGGRVPDDADALQSLPGVGRKTANVVLSVVFGRAAMAVDTHVFRVAERIGLTTGSTSPLTTERTLTRHIPAELVGKAHHWLILHGRYTCKARKPLCEECGISSLCRYCQKNGRTIH